MEGDYKTGGTDVKRKMLLIILIFISVSFVLYNNVLFKRAPVEGVDVDKSLLFAHVNYLTSLDPPRDSYHVVSLNKAADYIRKELEKHSDHIEMQSFEADGEEYRNVIASFGVDNTRRIIVGAHYDVFGAQPGADDNASAVAGLLELARLLKLKGIDSQLNHRIDLVAYTLEELPTLRLILWEALSMPSLYLTKESKLIL
jgi:hypothetical protein